MTDKKRQQLEAKLSALSFQLRQVAGVLSRVKTDEQGRVMMPKSDLEMIRLNSKLLKQKAPVNTNLN